MQSPSPRVATRERGARGGRGCVGSGARRVEDLPRLRGGAALERRLGAGHARVQRERAGGRRRQRHLRSRAAGAGAVVAAVRAAGRSAVRGGAAADAPRAPPRRRRLLGAIGAAGAIVGVVAVAAGRPGLAAQQPLVRPRLQAGRWGQERDEGQRQDEEEGSPARVESRRECPARHARFLVRPQGPVKRPRLARVLGPRHDPCARRPG